MKFLLAIITALVLQTSPAFSFRVVPYTVLQTSPSFSPDIVAYDSPALTYLGRWQDTGAGTWSGWSGGPQIVFKVSGVTQFHVVIDVKNPAVGDLAALAYNIDSAAEAGTLVYGAAGEQYSGKKMATVPLPDTGEHTVNLHLGGFNAATFAGTSKMTFIEILLPVGGSITSWTQGPKLIQVVGDSWLGFTND